MIHVMMLVLTLNGRQQRRPMAGIVLSCALGLSNPILVRADADCPIETKLLPADGIPKDDNFAWAVALQGDTAFVTDPSDEIDEIISGAVYVYRAGERGWNLAETILPDDAGDVQYFGNALDLKSDTLLVGSFADFDNGVFSGSAYVFRADGPAWVQEQKLLPDDGAAFNRFGNSVALFENVALLGAPGDPFYANISGFAYVFRYDGFLWSQEEKLIPSDGVGDDEFGFAVALDGDIAVVGARSDDDHGTNAGSAYVFRFDGASWVEEHKLLPPHDTDSGVFGNAVGILGQTIFIGATGDNDGAGTVYVFDFDGSSWNDTTTLRPADPDLGLGFGVSIDLQSEWSLIGAFGDSDNGEFAGSAYLFRFDGTSWLQTDKLLASDGGSFDNFGFSVALAADPLGRAVIGASFAQFGGEGASAAYIYEGFADADCNANGASDFCDLADGSSADENTNGVPDECEELTCEGDTNGDGTVDPLDSGYVLSRFGCAVGTGDPACDAADANADGIVDPLDVGYVLSRFGECE